MTMSTNTATSAEIAEMGSKEEALATVPKIKSNAGTRGIKTIIPKSKSVINMGSNFLKVVRKIEVISILRLLAPW